MTARLISVHRMLQIMLRRFDPGIAATDEARADFRDHEVNVIAGQHASNVVILNRAILDGRVKATLGVHDALLKAIERREVLQGRLANDDVFHGSGFSPISLLS
ncbi:MAG: hypothetical protein ACLPWG_02725 [Steroidobacteraceae bacterium]